jgi:hypothetical protein
LDEHERRSAAEAAAPSTNRLSIQRGIGGLYTKSVWLLAFFRDAPAMWYCVADSVTMRLRAGLAHE